MFFWPNTVTDRHHPWRDSFYSQGCLLELPGRCCLHLLCPYNHPDRHLCHQTMKQWSQIIKIAPRIPRSEKVKSCRGIIHHSDYLSDHLIKQTKVKIMIGRTTPGPGLPMHTCYLLSEPKFHVSAPEQRPESSWTLYLLLSPHSHIEYISLLILFSYSNMSL